MELKNVCFVLGIVLLTVSCKDDKKGESFLSPKIEITPHIISLKEQDIERVDLTNSVLTLNGEPWSMTALSESLELGDIVDKTDTSFDFLAQHVGIQKIEYEISTQEVTESSQILAEINSDQLIDNTPPTANNISLYINNNKPFSINVNQYISDIDNDTLTVTDLVSASELFTLNDNNTVTFNPNGHVGLSDAIYGITDEHGGYALAYITIVAVDSNSDLLESPQSTINEFRYFIDSEYVKSFKLDFITFGLIDDKNQKISKVYYKNNRVALFDDTSILYIPGDFVGVDQITYSITHEDGQETLGILTFVINNSTLQNQLPTALPVDATLFDNETTDISVQSSVNDQDNDPLHLINLIGSSGLASINPIDSLSIDYDPNGFVGKDVFTYVVSDGRGGIAGSSIHVDIIDSNPNPPVVEILEFTTMQDKDMTINLDAVISDTETPNSELTISNLSAATSPAVAELNDKTITYNPNGYIGTDVLTYDVSDGELTTEGSIVILVVPTSNDLFVVGDINMMTPVETPLIRDLQAYLSIDPTVTKPVSIVSLISDNDDLVSYTYENSVITFTPKTGKYGEVTWVYTIKDGDVPAKYAQGKIILSIVPPSPPSITEVFIKQQEGTLIPNIICDTCVPSTYKYQWEDNGTIAGREAIYTPVVSGDELSIRLDVIGADIYQQTANPFYTTYTTTLENIVIEPDNVEMEEGATQELQAIGSYIDSNNDQALLNITRDVDWYSTDENVAQVSETGMVTSVSIGSTDIFAEKNGVISNALNLIVRKFVDICGGQINDTDKNNAIQACLKIASDNNGKWFTSSPSIAVLNLLGYTKRVELSESDKTYVLTVSDGKYGSNDEFGLFDQINEGSSSFGQYHSWCQDLANIFFAGRDNWRRATKEELYDEESNTGLYADRGDMYQNYGWPTSNDYNSNSIVTGSSASFDIYEFVNLSDGSSTASSPNLPAYVTCVSE